MHIMSTNFVKTLVWKHEYDVTKTAHNKQMTTICHWMNPLMKIFCVRHCSTSWVFGCLSRLQTLQTLRWEQRFMLRTNDFI